MHRLITNKMKEKRNKHSVKILENRFIGMQQWKQFPFFTWDNQTLNLEIVLKKYLKYSRLKKRKINVGVKCIRKKIL